MARGDPIVAMKKRDLAGYKAMFNNPVGRRWFLKAVGAAEEV
mgnify:CR=1 FL=1